LFRFWRLELPTRDRNKKRKSAGELKGGGDCSNKDSREKKDKVRKKALLHKGCEE